MEVGVIPDVIVTRYGSWLESSLWYSQNLEGVKSKLKELKGGKIILKEKESVEHPDLFHGLMELFENYSNILKGIKEINKGDISINNMKVLLDELRFENDPAQIGPYMKKRLGKDYFLSILRNEGMVRSPMEHVQMRRLPTTTLKIERSFNVDKVFMCYYNSLER